MKITKSQLEQIIQEEIQNVLSEKKKKKKKKRSCWKTHKKVGMKKKGNRMVPNCVRIRKEELSKEELEERKKKKKKTTKKKKTDFSKEKKSGLHGWFSRKGGKGGSGWVDCNTCRKDKKTGRKKCKTCGRQGGEKRARYPHCRPTPSDCGTSKRSGKKSKAGKKG